MKTKQRGLVINMLIFFFMMLIINPAISPAAQTQEGNKVYSAFRDVSEQDPNLAFINYLSGKGIIKGFPDGSFHPSEGLTRAQAAAIVILAGGIQTDPAMASPFTDVRANHWARPSIAAAVKAGYISGFPDKTFHPEDRLTRAQAVSMLLRLSKQPLTGPALPSLSDMDSSHWAAPAVAAGIASGMLGLSDNQQQVYPEQAITRGDLTRALGVLLTKDPDLSNAQLLGKIQVKNGQVTIQNGNNEAKSITGSSVLKVGDTISTDSNAEAEINYGDGSSFLLKGNTELTIKEARGRSYIKTDGSPGTAVDWLVVNLKKGKLFGALASKGPNKEAQSADDKKTSGYLKNRKLAAALASQLISAAPAGEENMPWYETSKTQKVKVKVDMPWGVAAIRGSFWLSNVNANGSGSTSLLEGSASVIAGGQSVSLSPGQVTSCASSGAPPSPVVTMNASQASEWQQVAQWVQNTANAMQQSQEAASNRVLGQQPAANIVSAVNEAMQNVSNNNNNNNNNSTPSPSNNSSSGGNGGSSGPAIPISTDTPLGSSLGSYTLTDLVTVTGAVYGQSDRVLTRNFRMTPSAELAARATHYTLWCKQSDGSYVSLTTNPLTQSFQHLKKILNPDDLYVTFSDSNNYYNMVGMASLSSSTGSLANQASRSISGIISLPAGMVAPAGGIKIRVYASSSYPGAFYKEVSIPAGSNSVSYSVNVAPNISISSTTPTGSNTTATFTSSSSSAAVAASGSSSGGGSSSTSISYMSGYRIYYDIVGTYADPYIATGSYTNPVDVSGADMANCNLQVQLGKVLSGTITLPSPANTDIGIVIQAAGVGYYYKKIVISSGTSSASYSLIVPSGQVFKVYYNIYNAGNSNINDFLSNNKYLNKGYYNSSGTVSDYTHATSVAVSSSDVSNINLSILQGNMISGTITLADGKTAPFSGISIYVSAYGPAGSSDSSSTIPPGSSSVGYKLIVAPGVYTVSFNGMNSNLNGIDASSSDIAGINQTITISSAGSASSSYAPVLPENIANRSIILGNIVYGVDSSSFTKDTILNNLKYSSGDLLYKSDSGQWFNLSSQAATDASYLVSSNAIQNLVFNTTLYGFELPPIQTSSSKTTYYIAAGLSSWKNFTITPPNATLVIIGNTNPSIASLTLEDLGAGSWKGTITGGNAPGTNVATVRAACSGYTTVERAITINVLPGLSVTNTGGMGGSGSSVPAPYSAVSINMSANSDLWLAGDMLNIQIINSTSGAVAAATSSSASDARSISFGLPMGLSAGEYVMYVIKGGVPVAAGRLSIVAV